MGKYRRPYTLFKRGKYWYYRTYDYNGVRTTAKTTGQTSKAAASEYCDQLYLSGNLINQSATFRDYAAHFFDEDAPYLKDRDVPLAYNTVRNYRTELSSLISAFGDKKISDITYTSIRKYRSGLKDKYSIGKIQLNIKVLNIILKSAKRDGLIKSNPCEELLNYSPVINKKDAFSRTELKFMYQNSPEKYKPLILLDALTGMRISEAMAITEKDFKETENVLYVDINKQLHPVLKEIIPCKRNSSRQVPVIPELKGISLAEIGNKTTFYNTYRKLIAKLNSDKNLSFHSFRHFFITDTKAGNINPLKVEYMAGHSLKGIQQIYTHFTADDCQEVLAWQKEIYDFLTE